MKKIFLAGGLLMTLHSSAQNDRYIDNNTIAWGQLFTTVNVAAKWDALLEGQWRRTEGLRDPQQNLYRGAVQYRLSDAVSVAAGYGYIETFAYGDYPIAANGTFPEHRVFEQVVLKQSLSKLAVAHRFRVEQRWLGQRAPVEERRIDNWTYLNRFRYQLRLQHPLVAAGNTTFYGGAADEIFIGAGKNVGANIFDQNRLHLFLGAKLSNSLALEGGYINQTVMQGKRVAGQTIMQHNNGVVLSTILTLGGARPTTNR
jgi:hypothetical protein